MLTGLSIRDVVLIEALDLGLEGGLTALTGETGAGKSIVLDALGLATGARADAALVRRGAAQASAAAVFSLPAGHPAFALLEARGLGAADDELVLRRQVSADGRSRAFVNDQAASVGVLRELGALLIEVHGQHDAVGLLDARTHRGLLDAYAAAGPALAACRQAWSVRRDAAAAVEALRARAVRDSAEAEELSLRLAELDRLAPRPGEDALLAEERALLGAAEKVVADIAAARETLTAGQLVVRLSQAARALERARQRVSAAASGPAASAADAAHAAPPQAVLPEGAATEGVPSGTPAPGAAAASPEADPAVRRLETAAAAVERALIEADEAVASLDQAADAFLFDPTRLEKAEERLFALRAAARKLGVPVDALPAERVRLAEALRSLESADAALAEAERAADATDAAHAAAARALSDIRREAAARLSAAVEGELKPLKLDKARFRAVVEPLAEGRGGPDGADRVAFEVSTNPGAPFGPLGDIASGGELARFALALKAALAARGGRDVAGPTLIFDEVDQGVGGAVADAVGLRLKRLATSGQVLVVTHSPQVAARADAHWRVSKTAAGQGAATAIAALDPAAREEELARMLAGATVTDAARAAARALMGV